MAALRRHLRMTGGAQRVSAFDPPAVMEEPDISEPTEAPAARQPFAERSAAPQQKQQRAPTKQQQQQQQQPKKDKPMTFMERKLARLATEALQTFVPGGEQMSKEELESVTLKDVTDGASKHVSRLERVLDAEDRENYDIIPHSRGSSMGDLNLDAKPHLSRVQKEKLLAEHRAASASGEWAPIAKDSAASTDVVVAPLGADAKKHLSRIQREKLEYEQNEHAPDQGNTQTQQPAIGNTSVSDTSTNPAQQAASTAKLAQPAPPQGPSPSTQEQPKAQSQQQQEAPAVKTVQVPAAPSAPQSVRIQPPASAPALKPIVISPDMFAAPQAQAQAQTQTIASAPVPAPAPVPAQTSQAQPHHQRTISSVAASHLAPNVFNMLPLVEQSQRLPSPFASSLGSVQVFLPADPLPVPPSLLMPSHPPAAESSPVVQQQLQMIQTEVEAPAEVQQPQEACERPKVYAPAPAASTLAQPQPPRTITNTQPQVTQAAAKETTGGSTQEGVRGASGASDADNEGLQRTRGHLFQSNQPLKLRAPRRTIRPPIVLPTADTSEYERALTSSRGARLGLFFAPPSTDIFAAAETAAPGDRASLFGAAPQPLSDFDLHQAANKRKDTFKAQQQQQQQETEKAPKQDQGHAAELQAQE